MENANNKKTMVRLKKEIREAIKKRKKYKRESYNDIIKREMKL